MRSFNIGDHVRVSETVASEYASCTGIVVAIEQRQAGPAAIIEYVVEFNGPVRRHFLGVHIVETTNARPSASTE
jgi:hypothetical protein